LDHSFSKQQTLAAKGVAICFLLWHHLFGRVHTGVDRTFIFGIDFVLETGRLGKGCVCFFAILSAYGLTISYKKWKSKSNNSDTAFVADRYISLISRFLVVVAVTMLSGFFLDRSIFKVYGANAKLPLKLLFEALGLADLFGTKTFNSTWWYMSFAVILIAALPILYKVVEKYKLVAVFPVIFLPYFFKTGPNLQYLLAGVVGVYAAENNVFEKLRELRVLKNKYGNKAIKLLILLLILALFLYIKILKFSKLHTLAYVPISFLIILIGYEFVFIWKPIRVVSAFLGKHSVNMYMSHTFLYRHYFKDFYYSLKNPYLIFGTLLATSLLLSMFIELIKKPIFFDTGVEKFRKFVQRKFSEKAHLSGT